MSPAQRGAGLLVPLLLVLATGCSSSTSSPGEADAAATPSPRASVTPEPPPPAAPATGSCHALTVREATDPVDAGRAAPCSRRHTSVTVKVGDLDPVSDGHLLAIDSRTVRAQIEDACPDSPGAYIGGDETTKRLSRFEVVWFSPSLEQADAGANWYRCDIVAVRSQGKLLPLPARLKGVLDQDGALDRFGTCGTATAPTARGFERVVCSEPHRSRAISVVDLPKDARYRDKGVEADANSSCKDAAAEKANGDLKYTWTFEWPTRAQWAAGQRYGYCWIPQG
jgi:Septum formation